MPGAWHAEVLPSFSSPTYCPIVLIARSFSAEFTVDSLRNPEDQSTTCCFEYIVCSASFCQHTQSPTSPAIFRTSSKRSRLSSDQTSSLSQSASATGIPVSNRTHRCFDAVKICTSGGQRPGSSSVPTLTNRNSGELYWLQTAILQFGQPAMSCSRPLSEGVLTSSGAEEEMAATRLASIIALRRNAEPVLRWHQRQWQLFTMRGGDTMR